MKLTLDLEIEKEVSFPETSFQPVKISKVKKFVSITDSRKVKL